MVNQSQNGLLATPPATAGSALLPGLVPGADGWSLALDPSTASWAGAHGGTVLAALVRAVAADSPGSATTAMTVTGHLHGPVATDVATIRTRPRHAGRRISSVEADLVQDGARRATAHVLLAPAGPGASAHIWPHGGTAPTGRPEDHERLVLPPGTMPFADHTEIRPVGPELPFGGGDLPVLRAWLRLRDEVAYGPHVALVLLDAVFPSLYAVRADPVPIPTVELTAHLVPAADDVLGPDGWAFLEQRTVWSTDELCLDEAALWSADGRLLAQARQLRRILARRA